MTVVIASFGCGKQMSGSIQVPQATNPQTTGSQKKELNAEQSADNRSMVKMEKATFGAGCFWCVEAVFQELKGVTLVQSAYMGGTVKNPTYAQVCKGTTGHAEVCHLEFDPSLITFDELLEVFWKTHDPTTLNRQGNDFGSQYRSVIFYHNDEQKQKAEEYKKKLNEANAFPNPVVTEISPASTLYVAENSHQNYFNNNPNQPYCRALIPPKLEKMRQVFGDKLKDR
jgi:peptide-methionine (S)-S-oxide reductase